MGDDLWNIWDFTSPFPSKDVVLPSDLQAQDFGLVFQLLWILTDETVIGKCCRNHFFFLNENVVDIC